MLSPPPPNQLMQKANTGPIEQECLDQLREVLGQPNATWSSYHQKEALIAVMAYQSDVLALLKTGGGKSMLAIIPALLRPREGIVVILPLKSLVVDWHRKLKDARIEHQVYKDGQLDSNINLILVSVDKARFGAWRTAVAKFQAVTPITRIVFDEAHMVLLGQDFRRSLKHVLELREWEAQFILLTGTLPPSSEGGIKEAFGLLSSTQIIRQPSNRPELRYILESPKENSSIITKIIQVVEDEQRHWSNTDRGLVFVTYLEDGYDLVNEVSS